MQEKKQDKHSKVSRQDWKAAKGKVKTFGFGLFGVFRHSVFVVLPLEMFSSVIGLEGKSISSWGSGASFGRMLPGSFISPTFSLTF